jgi:hypothetical protein
MSANVFSNIPSHLTRSHPEAQRLKDKQLAKFMNLEPMQIEGALDALYCLPKRIIKRSWSTERPYQLAQPITVQTRYFANTKNTPTVSNEHLPFTMQGKLYNVHDPNADVLCVTRKRNLTRQDPQILTPLLPTTQQEVTYQQALIDALTDGADKIPKRLLKHLTAWQKRLNRLEPIP